MLKSPAKPSEGRYHSRSGTLALAQAFDPVSFLDGLTATGLSYELDPLF
jgi:hypothetical protein